MVTRAPFTLATSTVDHLSNWAADMATNAQRRQESFLGFFSDERFGHVDEMLEADILPWGVYCEHVSRTFLNGFINHVKPVRAWLIGHYRDLDEAVPDIAEKRYREPVDSRTWVPVGAPLTKQQAFDLFTQKGRVAHTDLSLFRDDMLILAKSGAGRYWFFWNNQDGSDCDIGRFRTDLPEAEVIARFDAWVTDRKNGPDSRHDPLLVPLHFFEGWLSM